MTQKIIEASKRENTVNVTVGEIAKIIDNASSFTEMMGSDFTRPTDHQRTIPADSGRLITKSKCHTSVISRHARTTTSSQPRLRHLLQSHTSTRTINQFSAPAPGAQK